MGIIFLKNIMTGKTATGTTMDFCVTGGQTDCKPLFNTHQSQIKFPVHPLNIKICNNIFKNKLYINTKKYLPQ
jgi:hypothetical protein